MTRQRTRIEKVVANGNNTVHIARFDEFFPNAFLRISGIRSRGSHYKTSSSGRIQVRHKILNPQIITISNRSFPR